MKFKEGYMITSGEATKKYIVEAVEHVLLRQGTIGVRVTIMLPHDPEGRAGVKEPLPDVVIVNNPKTYDDDDDDFMPNGDRDMGYADQTYNSGPPQQQQQPAYDNNNNTKVTQLLAAMALLSSNILHNNNNNNTNNPPQEVTVTPPLPSKANCTSDFAFLLGFFHWSARPGTSFFLHRILIFSFCDQSTLRYLENLTLPR